MIIAVDFDGILCENRFPDIGPPNIRVISAVRHLIEQGHEVILWTSRNGAELIAAVNWCEDQRLRFCAINGQAPSNEAKYRGVYQVPTRKIYADVYIDDHNIEFRNKRVLVRQIRRLARHGKR